MIGISEKSNIDMSLLSRKKIVYYVVLEKPCGSIPNKCNARSNRSVVSAAALMEICRKVFLNCRAIVPVLSN